MLSKSVGLVLALTVVTGGVTLSLFTCSNEPNWQTTSWSSGEPLSEKANFVNMSHTIGHGIIRDQKILLLSQEINGIPVEGSFLKTIVRNSRIDWLRGRYLAEDDLPHSLAAKTEGFRDKIQILKDMKDANCTRVGKARPQIIWHKSKWKLVAKRDCETFSGHLYELTYDESLNLIKRLPVATGFTGQSLPVRVFPLGPRRSDLERLNIIVSNRPQYLLADNLQVSSDAGLKFQSLQEVENTTPDEAHFDMIQAYFFTSRALNWVKQKYGFDLNQLKIRTQVGYPQKSNVAFYYGREVRLGSGDDETFSKIAWDPTIVVHEAMHAVIEALTGMPFSGEPGSLQEALADTLTALHLGTPNMGESSYVNGPYQRTLDSMTKLSEKNGKKYHDSLILSGTLWAIHNEAGEDAALDLTGHLLAKLVPNSGFDDVQVEINQWLQLCAHGERCERIRNILGERGWL